MFEALYSFLKHDPGPTTVPVSAAVAINARARRRHPCVDVR